MHAMATASTNSSVRAARRLRPCRRNPFDDRRTGLVDLDVLVRDDVEAVGAARGRAARPVAAGSRGWSGGRGARCPPRTSRRATNHRARRLRRCRRGSVATGSWSRPPPSNDPAGDRERRARPRGRARQLDACVIVAEIGDPDQVAVDRDDSCSRGPRTSACGARAARDVEHRAAGAGPTRRTARSTATGSRLVVRESDGSAPPAHPLDHDVGEQQDHRQPRDLVDRRERGRPVEVGRVVVAVLLHDHVERARRRARPARPA